MHVEGEVRGMASRAQPSKCTKVSLFEETPFTRSTKGYKSSKSSGPAARELGVEKEKEVLEGYQPVVDLTPTMKTGNEVAVKGCLLETEKLIETFHETRRHSLSTRVSDLVVVL